MNLQGVSVLLVDDDADSREMLSVALSLCGASVRVADSMRSAVTACDEARPDVILSDLSMPQHDGFDFLRAVRTRRTFENIPVIAVTGHAPLRERALQAGFADFLTKPVDPAELCDRVGASVSG